MNAIEIRRLTDGELTEHVDHLRKAERHQLVAMLVALGELEERQLYRAMGFGEYWDFLVHGMGYTNASAWRRKTAARLVRQLPVLGEYLDDGRLGLTTLCALAKVLEACNQDATRVNAILDRAAGKSEERIKELVAALAPKPVTADVYRRVPGTFALALSPGHLSPEAAAFQLDLPAPGPVTSAAEVTRPAGRIEPITAELRVLKVTVGQEFASDLEALKTALSNKYPKGDLVEVLHEAIQLALEVVHKRQRGSGRPQRKPSQAKGRFIPIAIREAVRLRDANRCAFVSAEGRRCRATRCLQFHHVVPYARGGEASVANLALRCRGHNLHEARQDFGATHMDRVTRRSAAEVKRPERARRAPGGVGFGARRRRSRGAVQRIGG
jgi:5-methylcytosine-specific restriction endonuclease McrA